MRAALLAVVLAAPAVATGAGWEEHARAVAQAVAARDRAREARDARAAQAAVVAADIARLKERSAGVRASPELERRLRELDRLAAALDGLERELRRSQEAVEQARGAFEAAARQAQETEALAETRRRVDATAGAERRFRPLLEIAFEPADGRAESAAKLELLRGERSRGADEARRIEQELVLLEARLEHKRRLLREAEAARRDAGAGLRLLEREVDTLALGVRELGRQRDLLQQQKATLTEGLARVETLIVAGESHLRGLSPRPERDTP
jgi:hypothetical protein